MKVLCKILLFISTGILYPVHLQAFSPQVDTVYRIKEVEIQESRLKQFSSGQKVEKIDSLQLSLLQHASLPDLLDVYLPVFIKSYGQGSLALPSMRGSSANHTAVMWNGFNTQSPLNGQIDLSLFPVFLMDEVSLQHGGSSALFGSGSVGGAVHINSKAGFNKGLHLKTMFAAGSYADFFEGFKMGFGTEKTATSVKLFNHNARNDFKYINTAQFGNPEMEQENAAFVSRGLMLNHLWRIQPNQQISLSAWYQHNEREIPPTMTSSISDARQDDENLRITANWSRYGKKHQTQFRMGFFDEMIRYQNPSASIDAVNEAYSLIAEFENRIQLHKQHRVNLGLHTSYSWAEAANYTGDPERMVHAFFLSYRFISKSEKLEFTGSIREEYWDNKLLTPSPAAGFTFKILPQLRLNSSVSRNYRIPTFNDFYWQPGGNPGLKPESGWNEDISLELIPWKNKAHQIDVRITVFNSQIDNWIVWLPSGNGIWTPQNIRKVWSRGLESNLNYHFVKGDFRLQLSSSYHFTKSTNEEAGTGNMDILGKQLLYVPEHQASAYGIARYKGFRFMYSHKMTGKRFVSSDNTSFLEAFSIANMSLGKNFSFSSFKVDVALKLNNIWNESYQVIEWRPMPGRNFMFCVTVEFSNEQLSIKK